VSYLVRVVPDPEFKSRLEKAYLALEAEINKNFPNSRVKLTLIGDKLMVSGQAHDVYDSNQIMKIARFNSPGFAFGTGGGGRLPISNQFAQPANEKDPLNTSGTPGL